MKALQASPLDFASTAMETQFHSLVSIVFMAVLAAKAMMNSYHYHSESLETSSVHCLSLRENVCWLCSVLSHLKWNYGRHLRHYSCKFLSQQPPSYFNGAKKFLNLSAIHNRKLFT